MALVALSKSKHAKSHFKPRQGYSFSADQHVIPVLLAELSKLIPHYIMGFIRQNDGFLLVALVGLGENRHAYLNPDGKWLCSYVPAYLRSYPFALAADGNNRILCIDDNHLTDNAAGKPLFDAEGRLTDGAAQALDFLQQCEQNRMHTLAAVAALAQTELLTPWELVIPNSEENKDPIKLEGFYRIDEPAMMTKIEPEIFANLRKTGAIALAYAQLFSMAQVNQVTDRLRHLSGQKPRIQDLDTADIEKLFGGGDTLKFNF